MGDPRPQDSNGPQPETRITQFLVGEPKKGRAEVDCPLLAVPMPLTAVIRSRLWILPNERFIIRSCGGKHDFERVYGLRPKDPPQRPDRKQFNRGMVSIDASEIERGRLRLEPDELVIAPLVCRSCAQIS